MDGEWLRPVVEPMGSAAHALGGLAIFAAALMLFALLRARNAPWIAAALAIGFYWGRETRDHERRLKLPPLEMWPYSWMPWNWSAKTLADLLWPAFAVLVVVAFIETIRRRRAVSAEGNGDKAAEQGQGDRSSAGL